MTALVDTAVLLARRGYRVLPVGEDKAPLLPRGFHDAVSDADAIRSWAWDGGVGLAIVIPERTFVLDVDPRNGGYATLSALLDVHGPLPDTRQVDTRSGGHHFYYALPDDRDLRGKLGPGVDVKKAGRGYVLVPPSDGYVYKRGGKPVLAPQWLLDELTLERRPVGSFSKPKYFKVVGGTPYGLAALRQKVEQVRNAEEGGRRANLNTCAFVLATLVAGGELDEDKACEALLDAAIESGLTEQQALAGMKSGWHAGLQQPRGAE